jgi:alkanesulfonate monooxygenase SsuD/methylene tetrahydromethanopterin reductase-like flavin-dependent oxidoreductase (luciferase family)
MQVSYQGMVVTGADEADFAAATQAAKTQLAFYGSTPAYRPVLELHGWGALQTELNTLSKRGQWEAMADLIDDEMLSTFAVVGGIDDVAATVLERFDGVVDRFNFYAPYPMAPERWAEVLAGFKR